MWKKNHEKCDDFSFSQRCALRSRWYDRVNFFSVDQLTDWIFVLGRRWTFNIIYHSIGCSFDFCSMRYSIWRHKFCEKKVLSLSLLLSLPSSPSFCLCAKRKLRHRKFVFGTFLFSVSFSFDSIWRLRPFSISTVPQTVLLYVYCSSRTRTSYFHAYFYQNRLPGNFRCLSVFCVPRWIRWTQKKRHRTNFIINSPFVCYCGLASVAFVQWWIYLLSHCLYLLALSPFFCAARPHFITQTNIHRPCPVLCCVWTVESIWMRFERIDRLKSLLALYEIIKNS